MEETWRVILSEEVAAPSPGAPGAARPAVSSSEEQAQKEQRSQQAPVWANVGKIAGAIVGVSSIIALVITAVHRSKIFSAFMDTFLTVLGTFVDILLIPLIPIFVFVLKLLMKGLPVMFEIQEKIRDFLKDPVAGIKNLFAGIGDIIKKIFDLIAGFFKGKGLEGIADMFTGIGKHLSDAFSAIGDIWSETIQKIMNIWGTSGLSTWEKIKLSVIEIFKGIGKETVMIWKDLVVPAWDYVKDKWGTIVIPYLKEKAREAWEYVKNIWKTEVVPYLKEQWHTEVVPFLKQEMKEAWDWCKTKMSEAWGWFVTQLKNLPTTLGTMCAEFVKNLPSLMLEWLKGVKWVVEAPIEFIKAFIKGLLGYQYGTPYVPETGIYMLHRGEQVIPAGATTNYSTNYNRPISVQNVFHISAEPSFMVRKIATTLDAELRASYIRGW